MCGETRIPRDMCAGNTLPGETYITVTPVVTCFLSFGFDSINYWLGLGMGFGL